MSNLSAKNDNKSSINQPSGQSSVVSHVRSTSAHIIVSQGYVPPYVSAGHVSSYGP